MDGSDNDTLNLRLALLLEHRSTIPDGHTAADYDLDQRSELGWYRIRWSQEEGVYWGAVPVSADWAEMGKLVIEMGHRGFWLRIDIGQHITYVSFAKDKRIFMLESADTTPEAVTKAAIAALEEECVIAP